MFRLTLLASWVIATVAWAAPREPESIRPWRGEGTWPLEASHFSNVVARVGPVPVVTNTLWYARIFAEAYDTYGHHVAGADEAARAALLLTAADWKKDQPEMEQRRRDLYVQAVEAGSRDPLVLHAYAMALMVTEEGGEAEVRGLLAHAAEKIVATDYPAATKMIVVLQAARKQIPSHGGFTPLQGKNTTILLDAASQLLGAVAGDLGTPPDALTRMCDFFINIHDRRYGSREPGTELVQAILSKSLPANNALGELYAGDRYLGQAWRARGGGYAFTVTGSGWRRFRELHALAEESYLRAWQRDPSNAVVAARMVRIMGERCDGDQLELWFTRAMALDPGNYDACSSKLFFLTPKWQGSVDAMRAFAMECYATGNWEGRIPFILVAFHRNLVGEEGFPGEQAYYLQPGVWDDIARVYEPYLERYPDAATDRSWFAYFAIRAERWSVAKAQLDILGNKVRPGVFGGRPALKAFQKEVEARVAGGAPPAATTNQMPDTILQAVGAGDVEVVRTWLTQGGRADSVSVLNESALSVAVGSQRTEIAALLLEHGANPNDRTARGESVLLESIGRQDAPTALLLLEKGADFKALNEDRLPAALSRAIERRVLPVVAALLKRGVDVNKKGKHKRTLLRHAAHCGYPEMIKVLIEHGADLEARDGYQYTPLMVAAVARKPEAAACLVDNGAAVDATTTAGTTALTIAAFRGHTDVIHVLLSRGANINTIYLRDGRTPLIIAVDGGHVKSVDQLLKRGADPTIRDKDGHTALDLARKRGNQGIVTLLENAEVPKGP